MCVIILNLSFLCPFSPQDSMEQFEPDEADHYLTAITRTVVYVITHTTYFKVVADYISSFHAELFWRLNVAFDMRERQK